MATTLTLGDSNLQVSSALNDSKLNITIFDWSIMLCAFGVGVGVGNGVGAGIGVGVGDGVEVSTRSELFGVATSDPDKAEVESLHPKINNTIIDMKICRYRGFIGQLHRNTYSSRKQMPFRHKK